MRAFAMTILAGILASCGQPQPAETSAQDRHVQANHCEVFVDKISPANGPHRLRTLTFFIKTLNERLDAPVAEVGFWTIERQAATGIVSPWHPVKAQAFLGAKDYWQVSFTINTDYVGHVFHRGALYVKTVAGTTYWLKRPDGRDFQINFDLFNTVEDLAGHFNDRGRPDFAANTRDHGALKEFNPQSCF